MYTCRFLKIPCDRKREIKMQLVVVLLLLPIITFTGCQVGPDYKRPNLKEKSTWSGRSADGVNPPEIIQIDWWTSFKDPYLDKLVKAAISGNLELKILLGRIQEAGATIKESKAALLPSAELTTTADFVRTVPGGQTSPQNIQNLGVRAGVSWELDIWGKNKSGYLASEASYNASQADYRAGYLKLVSELAKTYFRVREVDEIYEITEKFYKDNQQILIIYQNQYHEGIIQEWKVSRQEAEVKGLRRQILELQRLRKTYENRISTLLGEPAGNYTIPKKSLRANLKPVKVPVGLPSELLSRRPDIVAAEYRLLEATYQLGEAEAARLPSISLTGNAGVASTALSALLNQWALGIAPQMILPIFDGGRRKAVAEASKARVQIAENEYRRTVMNAFEEVENALINLNNRSMQKKVSEEKVKSLMNVRSQTIAQFQLGLISQLEILDIENELLGSKSSLIEIHRLLLDDTVNLYKSLGGGWH